MNHLLQFKEHGEIESVRIRSVARPDMKTTKKLAYIKQKFHEGKNNVNAYIRFKVTALSLFGSAVKNYESYYSTIFIPLSRLICRMSIQQFKVVN